MIFICQVCLIMKSNDEKLEISLKCSNEFYKDLYRLGNAERFNKVYRCQFYYQFKSK